MSYSEILHYLKSTLGIMKNKVLETLSEDAAVKINNENDSLQRVESFDSSVPFTIPSETILSCREICMMLEPLHDKIYNNHRFLENADFLPYAERLKEVLLRVQDTAYMQYLIGIEKYDDELLSYKYGKLNNPYLSKPLSVRQATCSSGVISLLHEKRFLSAFHELYDFMDDNGRQYNKWKGKYKIISCNEAVHLYTLTQIFLQYLELSKNEKSIKGVKGDAGVVMNGVSRTIDTLDYINKAQIHTEDIPSFTLRNHSSVTSSAKSSQECEFTSAIDYKEVFELPDVSDIALFEKELKSKTKIFENWLHQSIIYTNEPSLYKFQTCAAENIYVVYMLAAFIEKRNTDIKEFANCICDHKKLIGMVDSIKNYYGISTGSKKDIQDGKEIWVYPVLEYIINEIVDSPKFYKLTRGLRNHINKFILNN